MVRRNSAKGAIAGFLAGLVGAWAMNQYSALLERLRAARSAQLASGAASSGRSGDEDATVRAAEAISRRVAHHALTPAEKTLAGPAVHYAMGALNGALYGGAAELAPRLSLGRGLGFAVALWFGADEALVPFLRLSRPAVAYPLRTHARALGAHVVYGLTTDLLRRIVRNVL
jgi:hypothetical protein